MLSFITSASLLATTFTSIVSAVPINGPSVKRNLPTGSSKQMAVYFGQGSGQSRLTSYCSNPDIDIMPIGFVTGYPGGVDSFGASNNGWISTNFGNQCGGNYPGTNIFQQCSYFVTDVATCQQQYGTKILISIGGGAGSYKFSSQSEALLAAQQVWEAFGPVPDNYSGPRPFGSNVVDGFDLDLEMNGNAFVADFAQALRGYMDTAMAANPSKQYILTAAPQCVTPDAQLSDALSKVTFDKLFIQFYNTKHCSARAALDHTYGSSEVGGASTDISFNTWASASLKGNPELFIGLPGASGASGDAAFWLDQNDLTTLLQRFYSNSRFGGVMLWDAMYAANNDNYAGVVKDVLNKCQGPATTTTTTTTTTTSSRRTTTTTTSWAHTTTSSSSSSTTSSHPAATSSTSSTTTSWAHTTSASSSSTTSWTPAATSSTSSTTTTTTTTWAHTTSTASSSTTSWTPAATSSTSSTSSTTTTTTWAHTTSTSSSSTTSWTPAATSSTSSTTTTSWTHTTSPSASTTVTTSSSTSTWPAATTSATTSSQASSTTSEWNTTRRTSASAPSGSTTTTSSWTGPFGSSTTFQTPATSITTSTLSYGWGAWQTTSSSTRSVEPTTKSTSSEQSWGLWSSTTTSKLVEPTSSITWGSWPTTPADVYVTSTTTVYTDVCPTGFTTVTATITATITLTDYVKPTPNAPWPTGPAGVPTGFYATTTVCSTGCASTPVTVTVTIPVPSGAITKTVVPTPAVPAAATGKPGSGSGSAGSTPVEAASGKPFGTGNAYATGTPASGSGNQNLNGVKAFTGGAATEQAPATAFSVAVCLVIAVAGLIL